MFVKIDRSVIILDIEDELDISYGRARVILVNKKGIRYVPTSWVARILTSDHMIG